MLVKPPCNCGLDGVGLTAFYDSGNFNFQHILFLLEDAATVSSFQLECSVEICDETDPNSACNKAVLPCMDETQKNEYLCDGFCSQNPFECSTEIDTPSCKACVCENGIGAVGVDCPNNGDSKCASCDTDFIVENDACVAPIFPAFACGSQDFVDAIPQLFPNSCDNFDPTLIQANLKYKFSSTPIESTHMKVWYFTSTDKYIFNDANNLCKSAGLEMAQVHDDTEWTEILRVREMGDQYNWLGASRKIPGTDVTSTTDSDSFWTGTNNRNKDNYFYTNGQRLCYDKWVGNEPNGDREFFLLIVDTDWYDIEDGTHPNVICEYRCAK